MARPITFRTRTDIVEIDAIKPGAYFALARGSVVYIEALAYILVNHGHETLLQILRLYDGIGKTKSVEIADAVKQWVDENPDAVRKENT